MAGSSNRARRRGGEPVDSRLGQGFDRFLDVGRQLVNGVAGARPGSRPSAPAGSGRGGGRGGLGGWVEDRLDWLLEDEDDWREPWQEQTSSRPPATPRTAPRGAQGWSAAPADRETAYGEGWGRETDSRPTASRYAPSPEVQPRPEAAWGGERSEPSPRRQPLEAISRRSTPLLPPVPARTAQRPDQSPDQRASDPGADDWPDPEEFSVPRWRRPARRAASEAERSDLRAAEPQGPGGRPLPRSTRRRA